MLLVYDSFHQFVFVLAWIFLVGWFVFTIWTLQWQDKKSDIIVLSFVMGMATVGVIWKIKSLINEKNRCKPPFKTGF